MPSSHSDVQLLGWLYLYYVGLLTKRSFYYVRFLHLGFVFVREHYSRTSNTLAVGAVASELTLKPSFLAELENFLAVEPFFSGWILWFPIMPSTGAGCVWAMGYSLLFCLCVREILLDRAKILCVSRTATATAHSWSDQRWAWTLLKI